MKQENPVQPKINKTKQFSLKVNEGKIEKIECIINWDLGKVK